MTYKNDIENMFKDKFESFEIKPSNSLWGKISRKLAYKDFFRLNPRKFNIYYGLLILVTASTIIYISTRQNQLQLNQLQKIKDNTEEIRNNITVKDELFTENKEPVSPITPKETLQTQQKNKSENISNNNVTEKLHNKITVLKENTKVDNNVEGNQKLKLAKPLAEFSASAYEACEPASISFYNSSDNCDSYLWEFGNGETSSLSNPTFVFSTAGVYRVKLTVSSGSLSNSVTKEIRIHEKPKANFRIKKMNGYFINEDIEFENLSLNYSESLWSFGDGEISEYDNPTHSYTKSGTYNITLICKNENNCTDAHMLENIEIDDEKYKISVPNAFYLNTGGAPSGYWKSYRHSNTVFYPIFKYEIESFHMRIYNKYGTLVFESNNQEFGWNGYFNGQAQATMETYIYIIQGRFSDGKVFKRKGSVHMLPLRD